MKQSFLDFVLKNNIHLIIIYILISIIVYELIKRIIYHSGEKIKNKKQKTMQKLLSNIVKYVILTVLAIAILNTQKVDVTSFLAGLGIASVIVGLALKDMMEDILSGISIVFEDKFNVGDYVEINGFEGIVIDLSLKNTKIKNYNNTVKIINNRTISQIINYSKDNPKVTIDVPIPYTITNKLADKVLDKIIKRTEKEIDVLTGEVELYGLQKFDSSCILYRILVPVQPLEQFKVKRAINRIIKEEFDNEKISVPFNIIEVKNG